MGERWGGAILYEGHNSPQKTSFIFLRGGGGGEKKEEWILDGEELETQPEEPQPI